MSEHDQALPPRESVKALIVRMTKEAWTEKRLGVLLSTIGTELAKRPEVAAAEMGRRKLAAFIEQELSDDIRLLTSPTNQILRVAVPRGEVVDEGNLAQYFPQANAVQRATRSSGVQNAIVLAFSRPLAAGMKRVVTLSPAIRYRDIEESDPVPEHAKVVERKWIVDDGQLTDEERSHLILSNVAAWRQEVEVAVQDIAAKDRGDGRAHGSVLEVLLSALSEHDLKRIQLPLDIVGRLFTKRAK